MPQVDIEVNGRAYRLLCADGEEQRVRDLAMYVDQRLKELTGGGKLGSESQMLLMTCVILADELQEARASGNAHAAGGVDEAEVVAAVDHVTQRIEEVAARLERA